MLLAFFQVGTVLHRQGDQIRPQLRAFLPDDLPALEIGREGLRAAPDGAERADQMLLAETSAVQAHFPSRVVVPEVQVFAAATKASACPDGILIGNTLKVIPHSHGPCLGVAVACYSVAEVFSFIDPRGHASRQVDSAHGGFLFGHAWLLSRARKHTCC